MSERRYSDDEVAAIFARATEVQRAAPRALPSAEGMSLVELQAIGSEAGIPAEFVAEAARALDRPQPPPPPTFLGVPIGVAHTVELGRKLSDREWDHLVGELRETFEARGRITVEGSFRTWSNGNLQVMLEPSDDGHRVRFRTIRGEARGLLMSGTGIIIAFAALVLADLLTAAASPLSARSDFLSIGIVGIGLVAAAALRLPAWAKLRREQFQRLGSKLLGARPDGEPSA